ncbi:flagellar biosynthetic protein FliO [Ciceribacter sp. L1K22]|uniref:flagellar biosynthetic protein FliO n=1 Tax=Ciceribacter sp. L1K22 TaxID=2820275 RepID=UPI001ABE2C9B|nr:flagellar biosynthetic protein FliO [Ciceribacter sp. L1K22]MBO3760660.1 flagellar biosynthetic protein FliO [Ciceribacter sp. L1K22]
MLEEMVSAYGNRFLIAAAGVSLALLGLFVVLWVLRHRAPSPFVRGGRNRQPRLQVLDAAAVDARRRLVLVRRDNIEHLIMIGGPTDIVIESGIGDDRTYISVQQPRQEELPEPEHAAPLMPPVQQVTEARKIAPQPPGIEQRVAARAPEPAMPSPRPVPSQPPAPNPVAVQPAATQPSAIQPATAQPAASQPPVQQQSAPAPAVEREAATTTQPIPAARPPAAPTVQQLAPVAAQPAASAAPQAPQTPPVAPPRETSPTPITATRTEPSVDDVFDAARKRVLSVDPDEAEPAAAVGPEPMRAAAPGGSAFEQLLEAEMATHLDAVKAATQAAPRPVPTVLPPAPPSVSASMVAVPSATSRPLVTPAAPASPVPARPAPADAQPASKAAPAPQREEPNLQTEIARIFGEMESGRDK